MNDLNISQLDKRTLSRSRLLSLLESLDSTFVPPISSLVNLQQYCEKLIKNAEIVVASIQGEDVGFIVMYANDLSSKKAFITAIGVTPQHRNKGLGIKLLKRAIFIAKQKGMDRIHLEVNTQNLTALKFYYNAGFTKPTTAYPTSSPNFVVLERTIS